MHIKTDLESVQMEAPNGVRVCANYDQHSDMFIYAVTISAEKLTGEQNLLIAAYAYIRELEAKVRNIDGMTPGERGRRKTMLIEEQRRRIFDLEAEVAMLKAQQLTKSEGPQI